MRPIIICIIILLVNTYDTAANGFKFAAFQIEPFAFNQSGEDKGILLDIANAIAEESGIKITIDLFPYARVTKMLELGATDFTIITRTSNNDSIAHYVGPIFSQNEVIITKKENPLYSYNDLYDKQKIQTVGVLRGIHPKLALDPNISTYELKDFKQGLLMLNAQRISAFLTVDTTVLYIANKLDLTNRFSFPGLRLNRLDAWLQVSKNSPKAKDFPYKRVEESINTLRKSGAIDKIIKKYLGESYILLKSEK